jgi:hypothetical protein
VGEPYLVWALAVGVAIGGALVWFLVGRLPRRSDDLALEEIPAEAAWISATIEQRGGIAPPALVEEVLELHLEYLATDSDARLAYDEPAPAAEPPAREDPLAR